MRLLFFSDLHLAERPPISRSQSYADDLFAKLAEVKELCREVDISVFGGDLYHAMRPAETSHRLVKRTIEALRDWPVPLYVVVGNHDQTPESMAGLGRTALGVVLEALRGTNVQLLDEDVLIGNEIAPSGPLVQLSARPGHWTPTLDGDPQLMMQSTNIKSGVVKVKAVHAMVMPSGEGHPFKCVTMDAVETDADVVLLGHMHWETSPTVVNGTLYVGPGSIGRTSRSPGEMDRQVQVAVLTMNAGEDRKASVTMIPLKSMRPAEEVFTWVEDKPGTEPGSLFEGYVAVLESGLDVGGASVEDALAALRDRAPVGVAELTMRYLREAGL